jgi:hypothetical protein
MVYSTKCTPIYFECVHTYTRVDVHMEIYIMLSWVDSRVIRQMDKQRFGGPFCLHFENLL